MGSKQKEIIEILQGLLDTLADQAALDEKSFRAVVHASFLDSRNKQWLIDFASRTRYLNANP